MDIEAKLFKFSNRFLRSAHLERDWKDPDALQDYVLTTNARQSLKRILAGRMPKSSMRAWRVTGDYGSGKSSFALFLAHLFSGSFKETSTDTDYYSKFQLEENSGDGHFLPVLITGSRESMSIAIVRALLEAVLNLPDPEKHSNLIDKLEAFLNGDAIEDNQVIKLVKEVQHHVIDKGYAKGLLIILDEAGKFFEFAALNPNRQDIFLLQSLAELASRSGSRPLFLFILLHQGISAYAENLPKPQQKEWEKISGRFEELIWNNSVDQVAELIVKALNVQVNVAPKLLIKEARTAMNKAIQFRWFGTIPQPENLKNLASQLFPLHPTVLSPLVRLFLNFGQNERSLFAFLLSSEPNGLLDFVNRTHGQKFYRLHNLFDYVRSNFANNLNFLSYRNHWKEIEAIISAYPSDDEKELNILKTIGILNILNADDLLATDEIISLALHSSNISNELKHLKQKHVIHHRGTSGGYSLWSNTSLNLEVIYEQASKALEPIKNVAGFIRDRIDTRPLVARKHYIETGNLRHFEVIYSDLNSLIDNVSIAPSADGRILIPLCETSEDVEEALKFVINSHDLIENPNLIIAVPQPLQGLIGAVEEMRRWEFIAHNNPGLQHDKYALEEVSYQLDASQQNLAEQIRTAIGISNQYSENGLRWFHIGSEIKKIRTGRDVLSLISRICDQQYNLSPVIKNELINRRVLSGAAAGARLRLIERIFEYSTLPYLGMDSSKKPPEMSMYLSVLQAAGLHQADGDSFKLKLPSEEFDKINNKVLPSFERIREVLQARANTHVPIIEIFDELKKAPYGLREGLIPLFFAVFSVINEHELAFYEDGSFVPRITGSSFLRIIKAPETFEIQFYPMSGIRSDLFQLLSKKLNLKIRTGEQIELLDVVKPLFVFVASLPTYTTKTSRLSPDTIKVREALIHAVDPASLLFSALPKSLGIPAIDKNADVKPEQLHAFVEGLKNSIDELREAYPALLQWIRSELQNEFNIDGTFENMRNILAPKARALVNFVTETHLKSFCLRIADTNLTEIQWLESLGNLICAMPPAKWKEAEVNKYKREIHNLSSQFLRVESIAFAQHGATIAGEAVRVALTHLDGQERGQVIHFELGEIARVQELQTALERIIKDEGRLGIAATSRVLWEMLSKEKPNNQ